ncbi:MAG: hypothetical protein WDW38_004390 [Sanguina aurantia]
MGPKKKVGGKKGKKDDGEPPHDPSWEKAVESGIWERPVTDLPDANIWPTWGALRERVLTSCVQVSITHTASLRDAFASELVKLSPPELSSVDIQASRNLRNVVLSPLTACPKLMDLDCSDCPSLEYVLIQSHSLRNLSLKKCGVLTKALIHCPRLSEITITDCPNLETIMLWSDDLTKLDLTGCPNITSMKLQCPSLIDQVVPALKTSPLHVKPSHPPIAAMLTETYVGVARGAAEAKDLERRSLVDDSIIPHVHRGV